MKRFTADSQEKVSVKVSTEDGSQLSVMVIGQNNLFSANLDPIPLGLFALFWMLVFLALYILTQPANQRPQAVSILGSLPSSPQKVSTQ